MEQLDEGRAISIHGLEAEKAVSRALQQISEWGLTLPEVEPLVLDFGLGDFARIGEIEFWIANEVEAGYCGKFLFLFSGQTCPLHMHKQKHETFFLTKGILQVRMNGESVKLEQGGVLKVDPGAEHSFSAAEPSLLLEVSMPSIIADNYFADPRIPIGKGSAREST